ncbi:MAG: hypothetical protein B6I26_07800 [Desulfobacteraceae bacterium 4572_130]|nr:MAG: hypothetical protein B6I26_07800 [Desulfobacteraceae bacterium 4572_130]
MLNKISLFILSFLFVVSSVCVYAAEIEGVTFPMEKLVGEKMLKLNGLAVRKAMVFVKVFAGGFYLENPTSNAKEIIESEQVKYFYLHYLTDKATGKKIQKGFIEHMEKTNSLELVKKHRSNIELYASWLDVDMKPGSTSESIYIPEKGLTVIVNGIEKGTIQDKEFAQMYYRYSFGEKADSKLRKGYLGL